MIFHRGVLRGLGRSTFTEAHHGSTATVTEIFEASIGKVIKRLAAGKTLLAILVAPAGGGRRIAYLQVDPPVPDTTRVAVESAVADVLDSLPFFRHGMSPQIH